MHLTTIMLADEDREALMELAAASGKKRSECLRIAIREARARLRAKQARKGRKAA